MPIIPTGSGMGLYFAVMILTIVIGGGAQLYVSVQLKRYSRVSCSWGVTGAAIARRMASDNGISQIGINHGGPNQDFYDPRTRSVTLGTESYGHTSITAVATAVHEVGHACQHAQGYAFMRFRSALVPVVNLASNAWIIIFVIGLFTGLTGLVQLGIILFAAVLLFQLVTLPVEFDASRRGLAYLKACGMGKAELSGASKVLRACAFTYVAAALTALIQLLYLLLSARSED